MNTKLYKAKSENETSILEINSSSFSSKDEYLEALDSYYESGYFDNRKDALENFYNNNYEKCFSKLKFLAETNPDLQLIINLDIVNHGKVKFDTFNESMSIFKDQNQAHLSHLPIP